MCVVKSACVSCLCAPMARRSIPVVSCVCVCVRKAACESMQFSLCSCSNLDTCSWISLLLLVGTGLAPSILGRALLSLVMALFIFGGMTTSEELHGEETRQAADVVCRAAAQAGFVIRETHLCFPPEKADRTWAHYVPSREEVAAHGDDWWSAHSATRNVPMLAKDLEHSAGAAWAEVEDAMQRVGSVLLCGYSNGAIVATELATTHPDKVRALLLLSGLPSTAQQRWVARGIKRLPPTCITCGAWERYFGGPAAFQAVASDFGCRTVHFDGTHCKEDEAALVQATQIALGGGSSH